MKIKIIDIQGTQVFVKETDNLALLITVLIEFEENMRVIKYIAVSLEKDGKIDTQDLIKPLNEIIDYITTLKS
jgi:thioredoxin-related protein